MIANKKGIVQSYVGVFFLLAVIALIITTPNVEFTEPIGVKQYSLLITNERLESANNYLDEAVPYAGARAIDKLFRTSGLYSEETENRLSFYSPCGVHIYPLYNREGRACPPDFRNNYKAYVRQDVDRYMKTYDAISLDIPYFLEVQSLGGSTKLKGTGLNPQPYDLASKSEFVSQATQVYPRGIFGGYTQERQVICGTGECFAQAAQYFTDLYKLAGFSFSYVQGGESPYTYKDTLTDKTENKESIFKEVEVTRLEVGRNKFTEPGFDASGWLWWVGWHTGVPQLLSRQTSSQDYYQILSGEEVICSSQSDDVSTCSRETILRELLPGDLLFVDQEGVGVATHVMIYLGNGQVSHSRGSRGLIIEELPAEFVSTEDSNILAAIRLSFNQQGQESLEVELPKVNNYQGGSCVLAIDYSQINEDAIRADRVSMERLITKLEEHNRMQAVERAADTFGTIPKEVLLAFMRVEIGGDLDGFLAGTVDTRNRDSGAVGVLQVTRGTCNDLNERYGACDYDAIKDGDVDEGIIAGAAYLHHLVATNQYLDNQRPNYYFLGLAYNSGPGSLNEILRATSERTQIPITQLQWRDVTFEDLAEGLRNNGENWGDNPIYYPEKWEYPNLVAKGLSTLCDGSALASYQPKESSILFQPRFSTTVPLDLNALDLVNEFARVITESCTDRLDECVTLQTEFFSETNEGYIQISQEAEEEPVAYKVADEWMNCFANEQADCYCTIDLEDDIQTLEEPLAIEFLNSGSVSYGPIGWGFTENDELDQSDKIDMTRLPFKGNQREGQTNEDYELYLLLENDRIRLNKLKDTSIGRTISLRTDDIWTVGEDTEKLALKKSASFLDQDYQTNEYQQQLIEYAQNYLGTAYHISDIDGELQDCSAQDAQSGLCKTQCGSFVSSSFLYTLGSPSLYGPGIVPRGNGNEKCDHETMSLRFLTPNLLQPGDVFASDGATQWGHTGIYVGRGRLSNPVVKFNHYLQRDEPFCYLEFTPDETFNEDSDHVFIHSVGPVCYNTLTQLEAPFEEGGQNRNILSYCRHDLLQGIDQDEFETVEQSQNAEEVAPMQWAVYEDKNHKDMLCRDNKRYYRFMASFGFTEKTFGFSLYLDDTTPPPAVTGVESDTRMCGTTQVQAISWQVPKTSENIYAFNVQLQDLEFVPSVVPLPDPYFIVEKSYEETQETNPTELTKIHQLYRRETTTHYHYTYLVKDFEGEAFVPEQEYFYSIRPIDHYNNEQFEVIQRSFTLPEPLIDDVLDGSGLGNLIDDIDIGFLGECSDVSDNNPFDDIFPDITDIGGGI